MCRLLLMNCLFTVVLATQVPAQDHIQWSLREDSKMRLSKGGITGKIVYSPGGTRLAVVSSIGIWIYDAETYQELDLLTGHTNYVNGIAFSPDGTTLASRNQKGIFLWDVTTGEHKHTLTGHTGWVNSVAFSPDGKTLASGSWDKTIRLWDAATSEHKHTLTGHTGRVFSIAFSPDGQTLASGSEDDTIRLWDVTTGEHKHTLTGCTILVRSIAFSLDGQTLASGSGDKTIRLWDVATGEHKHTLTGHTGWVNSVAFSPDGKTLASGSGDKTIRLWDVTTGEHKHTLSVHTSSVGTVAFSSDGRTLASGSSDGMVLLWELSPSSNANAIVNISPSSLVSPAIGEQFTLSLDIADGQDVAGYQATVQFDPTALRYVESANGDYLPQDAVVVHPVVDGNPVIEVDYAAEEAAIREIFTLHAEGIGTKDPNEFMPYWLKSESEDVFVAWDFWAGDLEKYLGWKAIKKGWEGIFHLRRGKMTVEFERVAIDTSAKNAMLSGRYRWAVSGSFIALTVKDREERWKIKQIDYTNEKFGKLVELPLQAATISATSLAGESNGDGTLATLTFEVVGVKVSNLILSEVLLTDRAGELPPLPLTKDGRIVEPAVEPSSTIVHITPSRVPSPSIGRQLVFNVDIAGGQDIVDYRLNWEFDRTALKHLSSSQGDYLGDGISNGGVSNGDGRLMTGTFEVLAAKASTVSVCGYLTALTHSIPIFASAEVIVPLLGDVNRDRTVNVLDLILVASSFNQQVSAEGNPADINEDGVVNIVDLVKVAGALGNAGAAPSAQPQILTMLTTTDVHGWLTQAQNLDLTDATLHRGIIFLEQLLAALIPEETALLANYPNPFNPETWIPYHLAEAADVKLTIYDTKGTVVRQFDLGHQRAGYYADRSKAVYWDGRNATGESVASGTYFYHLRAGEYSQTRRLVILK